MNNELFSQARWISGRKNRNELFEYIVADGQAIITEYVGGDSLTEVVIPDTLEGCPVTEIGDEAFEDDRYSNSLVDEDIGETPRGYSVIKKLTIPDTVRVIGESAFEGLASLEEIKLPSSLEIIGDFAFSYLASYGTLYIPNGVKKIGNCSFGNPLFSDIYIPPSLTEIDGCALGESAGVGPSTNKINLHFSPKAPPCQMNGYPWDYGYGYGYSGIKIIYDYEEYDPDSPYVSDADVLKSDELLRGREAEIPYGFVEIGKGAFRNRKDITAITIPDSVTYIAEDAFRGCESLKEINIPESVFHIDAGAFAGCARLTQATIRNKRATIYPDHSKYHVGAFKDCTNLTIICAEDSFAYKYCQENKINVKILK